MFIDRIISSFTTPGAETPINTSAPAIASARDPASAWRLVSSAMNELVFVLVEAFPSAEYGAFGITDNDLVNGCADIRVIPDTFQQACDGIAGCTGPADDDI